MKMRLGFFPGFFVIALGCGRLIDADEPYALSGGTSSGSTVSGAGGAGGKTICTTNADCPSSTTVCRVNECIDGGCQMNDAAPGTPCSPGLSTVCNGLGQCVECTLAEHCVNIVEDQCTKRACDNNTCQIRYLDSTAPASPAFQQPGDCKIVVCDGFGGTKIINDDTDTPDDDNGCTTDTCLNGSEVHTKVATGTNCGTNSFCNSQGSCVGCNKPPDCAGTFDFCKNRTCQSNVCGVNYTADGTPLPSSDQTPQDCFVIVCDGAGNKVTRIDTNDGPSDGNPCTRDSCTSDGTPTHPAEIMYTPCSVGDNDACDGMGTCKKSNGKICGNNDECASGLCIDGVCCSSTCDSTCSSCNVSPATAGTCTLLPLGQTDANAAVPCTGTATCDGNGSCKKNDGQSCASSEDCLHGNCVDSFCCESACTTMCKTCGLAGSYGKCVNLPIGSKDDSALVTCNGTQACDGVGGCKLANGQTCSGGSQCASGKCMGGNPKTCQP